MTWWKLLEIYGKESTEEKSQKKFRTRLFGIFYEELLKTWFKMKRYKIDCGKPVAYKKSGKGRRIYDFLLEKSGKQYIVEAKCWPSYGEGACKKLSLQFIGNPEDDWDPGKMQEFLNRNFLKRYKIKVSGETVHPIGKILVWWDYNQAELSKMKKKYGFAEILSIKKIIDELKGERSKEYLKIVRKHGKWANTLFKSLA